MIAGASDAAARDLGARAAFLEERLNRAARNAKIWTGLWAGVFAVGAVGGTALAITVPSEAKPDYYLTVAKTVVGLASLGVPALRAIDGARWLKRRSRADLCAFVHDGERLLAKAALSEEAGRGVLLHVGNLALNLGSLMILGIAFQRWDQALVQGIAGSAIGEAYILTRPRTAERALEAYRAGRLTATGGSTQLPIAVVPLGLRDGSGLAVAGSF